MYRRPHTTAYEYVLIVLNTNERRGSVQQYVCLGVCVCVCVCSIDTYPSSYYTVYERENRFCPAVQEAAATALAKAGVPLPLQLHTHAHTLCSLNRHTLSCLQEVGPTISAPWS
jgi:hypothetical protein